MKELYVVRLDDRGFYGKKPWTPVPKEEAIKMNMKTARAKQNRFSSHNMGYAKATIERYDNP